MENSTLLPNDVKNQFVIAEYNALRAEIIKRSEIRYQIISLTLIIAGTILTIGLPSTAPSYVLFVFPIIGCFLTGIWAHNVAVPRRISTYIKENIERQFKETGWETVIQEDWYSFSMLTSIISSSGIFLGLEFITLILGLLKSTFTPTDIVLIVFDCIAFLLTLLVVRSAGKKPKRKNEML